MKKTIILLGAIALIGAGTPAKADEPGSGHAIEVTPGDWDDDDPKLNFNFQDTPQYKYSGLRLTLFCGLPEARILYTTNPDATPENEEAWTVYTEPIYLTEDCTVRFFARSEGYNDSDIQEYTFVFADHQALPPVIATDMEKTHIVMTSDTPGASIRYTTDGSEPNAESTLYEGPVELTANRLFRARSFADEMFESVTTEYAVDFLTAGLPSAKFINKALTLTPSDPSESVYFTTNPDAATDNTEAWGIYTGPILLTEDCTVRYLGRKTGYNDSEVGSFSFVYAEYQTAAPRLSTDPEGKYVVMECETEGAEIRYTTDGSEPTVASTLYNGPVEISDNRTFRARAFAEGLFDSNTVDFTVMSLAVPNPTAVFENKMLVLSCTDPKAGIKYTLDVEATPDNGDAWKTYDAPIALTEDCTVRFYGFRSYFYDSDIQSFIFLRANYTAATPSIERSEDGRSIVMATETEGAEIRYTTDGSEPTEESELYTEPVFIIQNCKFRARAFAEGLFESAVSEYSISILTMMTPVASFENLLLHLSVWDESASVWYTLNTEAAHEEAEAWTLYTEPLSLTEDCTVRFFARRGGFLDSQIASFEFVYSDWQTATPVITTDDETNTAVISCETEGATVRYTLDGSEPTEESEAYNEPIEFSGKNMTIRARAFAEGKYASEISEMAVSGVWMMSLNGIKVCKEGGNAVVYSDTAITLLVYTLDGTPVRILNVGPGRNVVDGLDSNIYIIGNVRIRL